MANFTMDICESGQVLEHCFFGNGGTSFLGYGESRNHVMLLACWLEFWERKVVVWEVPQIGRIPERWPIKLVPSGNLT